MICGTSQASVCEAAQVSVGLAAKGSPSQTARARDMSFTSVTGTASTPPFLSVEIITSLVLSMLELLGQRKREHDCHAMPCPPFTCDSVIGALPFTTQVAVKLVGKKSSVKNLPIALFIFLNPTQPTIYV